MPKWRMASHMRTWRYSGLVHILTAEAYLLRERAHVGLGEMPPAHGSFRAAALTLAGMEAGRLAARAWGGAGRQPRCCR